MKSIKLIFGVLVVKFSIAGNEKKYTQQEYVNAWKETAIEQMNLYKIPASITLAQGILESGNGNSDLAKQANNHFGIKCADWKGETFFKNDDQKNECFRKYTDAKQSYEDHSLFLSSKSRYISLFSYEITDYKAWAQGLKNAGYATNPSYPQLLIDIIERLNLNQFDNNLLVVQNPKKNIEQKVVKNLTAKMHLVENHKNNIKFITAKKGDTYYRISKEFEIGLWQLYKYNDFGDKKDYLVEGDIIYLEPKKRKSKTDTFFNVKEDIYLRDIAQHEGIKVQQLMKMNDISSEDVMIKQGNKIRLK